jgi:hypothetical protein
MVLPLYFMQYAHSAWICYLPLKSKDSKTYDMQIIYATIWANF